MEVSRELSRKNYDHYEKKLEQLEAKKDEKIKKGTYCDNGNFATKLKRVKENKNKNKKIIKY